jgi:acetyl-CoA C-acetyltransferase
VVMAKLLHSRGGGRGLISVCTAGGMGVAAILEGVKTLARQNRA